jgi:NTE family protein
VLGTDLHTGLKHVFNSGSVARAVQISCSLPHFFLPIEHENKMLIDGGLSEYLPIQTTRDMGAQFVIGVNLGSQTGDYNKPKHILQLFMQVNNLVAKQNMRRSVQYADYLIEPDLTEFSAFDFEKSENLIELLYDLTKSKIDEIQKAYDDKNKLFNRVRNTFRQPLKKQ